MDKDHQFISKAKVYVNGIEVIEKESTFAIQESFTSPYAIEVRHSDYPVLYYPRLMDLPPRLYLFKGEASYFWEDNVKVPFEPDLNRIGLIPSPKGLKDSKGLTSLFTSIGLEEDTEFIETRKKELTSTGWPPEWASNILRKKDGTAFDQKESPALKAIRESDLVQHSGPLVGDSQLLDNRLLLRFHPNREQDVKDLLAQKFGQQTQILPFVGGYYYITTNAAMGFSLLQVLDELQNDPALQEASATRESLYLQFD